MPAARRLPLPGAGALAGAAALLAAALLVGWIRLVPLGLPALAAQARALARGEVARQLRDGDPPAAAAVDAWIAAHPDAFAATVAAQHDRLTRAVTYLDAAGRPQVLLGDYDSYAWLRGARALLRAGSECDAVVAGQCRDTLTLAPVGTTMRYAGSPHTFSIAALHRALTAIDPSHPLPLSAYLIQVLIGMLGVPPAFAIGRRLAGVLGGFVAAVVANLQPAFLVRSLGSDNDVWNVVLPLWMVWALVVALDARHAARRLAAAVAAGALAGLHAAVWRGWQLGFAVAVAGLLAAAALYALRRLLPEGDARVWRSTGARRTLTVLAAYAPVALLAAWLAGGALPPLPAWSPGAPPLAAASTIAWPSALALVGELSAPSLGGIAAQSYGALLFFAGWLGMLLAVLPRGAWQVGHFAVLITGTILYRLLLGPTGLGAAALAALLALPLAAAVVVQARAGTAEEADDAARGLLVAVWLLAALMMAYEATRFVLLLAAPLGLATGVAAGRLGDWLADLLRDWLGSGPAPRLIAGAAVLGLTVLPLRAGHAAAAAYLPAIDRAWVESLTALRDGAPPDAIVNAWWDYGYWIKFLAERRVSADGGTLLTRVPLWLARAQTAATEAETVGLLRMLDCGSDAAPYPEGARGAMGRLQAHGVDEARAYALLTRIAPLGRGAAADVLAGAGLSPAARADVLAATHCTPPPAYLVLSSEQAPLTGWWGLGAWRPEDGGAAPADEGLATRTWRDCRADGPGYRCAIDGLLPDGRRLAALRVAPDDPAAARLTVRRRGASADEEVTPSVVLLAGGDDIARLDQTDGDSRLAVLLDPTAPRVLVGTPAAITSTYTRLMFLDGRGLSHFRKLAEHNGAWDRRVVTFAVEW